MANAGTTSFADRAPVSGNLGALGVGAGGGRGGEKDWSSAGSAQKTVAASVGMGQVCPPFLFLICDRLFVGGALPE